MIAMEFTLNILGVVVAVSFKEKEIKREHI
jgi:hypothetical protein